MVFVSLPVHPTGITRVEMVEQDGSAHLQALAINDLSHLRSAITNIHCQGQEQKGHALGSEHIG